MVLAAQSYGFPRIAARASLSHTKCDALTLAPSGFIAPEVGNLSLLIKLDLGNNKLFGEYEIPQERRMLSVVDTLCGRNASSLALMHCSWSSRAGSLMLFRTIPTIVPTFATGSIPPELGKLKALQTLDLYHNQLSGENRSGCEAHSAVMFSRLMLRECVVGLGVGSMYRAFSYCNFLLVCCRFSSNASTVHRERLYCTRASLCRRRVLGHVLELQGLIY